MLKDTLTRREFLGRAAAGAAVAAIGANAAGLARAQGSNDRISIGIIGPSVTRGMRGGRRWRRP